VTPGMTLTTGLHRSSLRSCGSSHRTGRHLDLVGLFGVPTMHRGRRSAVVVNAG
jgi:hypothetical protein